MEGVAGVCLETLETYICTYTTGDAFAQISMSVLRAPTTVTRFVLTLLAPSPAPVRVATGNLTMAGPALVCTVSYVLIHTHTYCEQPYP